MPPCILFTIHLFLNARCLIICLSEHRTFTFRLALNTLRPGQDGPHFGRRHFQIVQIVNENILISIKISLKSVSMGPV